MMNFLFLLLMTTCVVKAEPTSLGWWLLPDNADDWPHELEEDNSGNWKEIWVRPKGDPQAQPHVVMEQTLGARWAGLYPDKEGRPTRAILVLADREIVDLTGDKVKLGKIDPSHKVVWADGSSSQNLYEFRKSRRRRRRGQTRIKFGKITLPPLSTKTTELMPWSVERLADFLGKIPNATEVPLDVRDLSTVAQIADQNGSVLRFRYASSCSLEERGRIEDALANQVEPRLTCWMEKNPEEATKVFVALLQRPVIDCKPRVPMNSTHCGMASVPYVEDFFAQSPQINLNLHLCKNDLDGTLLHEIFHLGGVRENPEEMEKANEVSESCDATPGKISYENSGEGFKNDLQVETRMYLFRKVRDEAVGKWGWSQPERDFLLGTICSKMGDKYCSRRFFQQASEGALMGMIELPEGKEVTWSSVAQFGFFDSITEDLQRMHELVHYLHRDPNGTLLRRLETGVYRMHEFFVARTALEAVQNNKGVCKSDTEDRIMCEDLVQLAKTPWFRNP